MRKVYWAAVRKEFDQQMRARLPQFNQHGKVPGALPGDRPYCLTVSGELTFYVNVIQLRMFENFDVEIGWSENRSFPEYQPASGPEDPPKNGGKLFRVTTFFKPWREPWYVEPNESLAEQRRRVQEMDFVPRDANLFLPNVPVAIAEVMDILEEYALPYFERIAKEHGIELTLKGG